MRRSSMQYNHNPASVAYVQNVHSLLFGINLVGGRMGEVVRDMWSERFTPYSAFLADVTTEARASDMTDKLIHAIRQQGIADVTHKAVIMVAFMDMTQPVPNTLLAELAALPERLNNLLHCNVSMMLQFAHVGRIGAIVRDEIIAKVENAVEENLKAHYSHHLYVLAEPALSIESNRVWEPAISLTDLLRGEVNPHEMLPSIRNAPRNSCVGYIGFGQCNPNAQAYITKRIELLEDKFRQENLDRFRIMIAQEKDRVVELVNGNIVVRGDMQPLHPHMEVPNEA